MINYKKLKKRKPTLIEQRKIAAIAKALTGVIFHKIILELEGDVDENDIDDLYCKKIRTLLSDEELDFILWAHDNNHFKRQQKTLREIKEELADRVLLPNKDNHDYKCYAHPRYKGVKKPKIACSICWDKYKRNKGYT